jgi:hypothetical protein
MNANILSFPLLILFAPALIAQSISICEVPSKLPAATGFGSYSPPICFHYAGLQSGEQCILKVWLLTPGLWNCASSQWCERTFTIDNTGGNNSEGDFKIVEDMDVYNYSRFDWVVRLYDHAGREIAFAEQYIDATMNRPPTLNAIGHRFATVGQSMQLLLTANDPESATLQFGADPLPSGASLDTTTGLFRWTPASVGDFQIVFSVTDGGDGALKDAELITISVTPGPVIVSQPVAQVVRQGTNVTLSVVATDSESLAYQWQFDEQNIRGATNSMLLLRKVSAKSAGQYRVIVSSRVASVVSDPALLTVFVDRTVSQSVKASLTHVRREMDLFHNRIPVYDDTSSAGNRLHARGQLPDQNSDVTINGSWANNPHSGATAIRCSYSPRSNDFGGFYFMNGILVDRAPVPYFGGPVVPGTSVAVTNSTGLDLSDASALSFWARGQMGGEKVEFFFGGVGRDAVTGKPLTNTPFPDSTARFPKVGKIYKLTTNWQKFTINLSRLNRTNIMGGFGWVASATNNPTGVVFFLDDIQFQMTPPGLIRRLNEPRFIRSFVTRPVQPDITDSNIDDDLDFVLRNTAFVYDNALAILAFLAEGSSGSIKRAQLIGNAFVYAVNHDRTYTDGRLRSAYAAGDIALPKGWQPNGRNATVPSPGFYVEATQSFYEVENADIDTGNNAWAMIALLGLYNKTMDVQYLQTAKQIGRFVLNFWATDGLYQGFRGGIRDAESATPTFRSYASTEHNLDLFAAFRELYLTTGEVIWNDAAEHARQFVEAMWDKDRGCYLTGTANSNERNVTPGQLPLDTQTWSVLALTDALILHPQLLICPEQHHQNMSDGFTGFDFNEDKDGVWFEGTAQMTVAYAYAGRTVDSDRFREMLRIAQQIAAPYGNGQGIVAASHDGVTSGFGFKLFRRIHLGATAWNVFAQLGFNPYYQTYAPFPPTH